MSPMMDMSAALTNPYTLDTCVVARRQQIVDETGIAANVVTFFNPVYAVIYPDGKNSLDRKKDSQSVTKTLTVIAKFAFRAASGPSPSQAYQADLVKWRGAAFVVIDPQDYSQYGTGFIKALCTAIPITQFPAEVK